MSTKSLQLCVWLGLTLGATLLSGCADDEPTEPEPNSPPFQIAYTANAGDTFDIFLMDSDGTQRGNLTNTRSFNESDPCFNGAGTRIAYSSDEEERTQVWVMDADGRNRVRVTNNPGVNNHPGFSADGRRIAFTSNWGMGPAATDIYIINSDGTGITRLTTDPASDFRPRFTPDSAWIVFTSDRDGNREVYRMRTDGTEQQNMTNNPAHDWNPTAEGGAIYFTSTRAGDRPQIFNLSGAVTQLSTDFLGNDWAAGAPDGSGAIFASGRNGGLFDLYRMGVSGEDQAALTSTTMTAEFCPTTAYAVR